MTKRYNVGVPHRSTGDDVGADEMAVGNSGSLEFYVAESLTVAYPAGKWLSAEFSYDEGAKK